jgi:hypothetical protein
MPLRLEATLDGAEVSAQQKGAVPDVSGQLHRDLLEELQYLTEQSQSGFEVRVELLTPSQVSPRKVDDIAKLPRRVMATQRLGDRIALCISATEDCYAYLFDIGTTGKITLLFPNQFTLDNRLRAGVPRVVPAEHAPYDFVLSGAVGSEVVQLFGLDRPIDQIYDAEPLPNAFEPIRVPRLTRDIHIIAHTAAQPQERAKVAWSQIAFQVQPI